MRCAICQLSRASGADPIETRRGFAELLDRIEDNSGRSVCAHDAFPRGSPLASASRHAAAALVSKGRLIACTVLGLMPNSSAIFRTPLVRPGSFRAARMRVSSSGPRPAQPLTFILGSPQAGTDTLLDHRALKLGEDAHHLEERLTGWRRGVDTLGLEEQINFQGV